MKKNGFTLIELMAVIIILGFILVIIFPKIENSMEDSRKNIATESAYGYKKAVDEYYYHKSMNKEPITLNGTYIVSDTGVLTKGNETHNINPSGSAPTNGKMIYEDDELVRGCLTIGKYKVEFENDKVINTEKGTCPED